MMLKGIFVAKVGNVYDSLIKKTRTPSKTQADGGRKNVLYAAIDVMHAKVAMPVVLDPLRRNERFQCGGTDECGAPLCLMVLTTNDCR